MNLKLTESERAILTEALRATVKQLDQIMENTPSREVADAANGLSDILDKLEKGNGNDNSKNY